MSVSPRRRTALLTAITFVAGMIALPALHLADHAAPHEHGHPHSHPHQHPHEPQPFNPDHGKHSAAHFGIAINDDVASSIELAIVGSTPVASVAAIESAPVLTTSVSVRRFRGPPHA